MSISLIVAASENDVIGRDGALPWHLPADLKRFKKLTIGHDVVMGRKTYQSILESLGRPLPKRRSLVLSRDLEYRPLGAEMASGLEQALELAAEDDEIFVIGGASVFAEALPRADRLYLTRVHADIEGDVYFPEVDLGSWKLVSEERHEANDRHAYAFSFLDYERLEPVAQATGS